MRIVFSRRHDGPVRIFCTIDLPARQKKLYIILIDIMKARLKVQILNAGIAIVGIHKLE